MAHKPISTTTRTLLVEERIRQGLPDAYFSQVQDYFWPLCLELRDRLVSGSLTMIGIQGVQGSGKSTFAGFLKLLLEHEFGWRTVVVSIDDFYLTKTQRQALSAQIHPLLATRGVPGTHDIKLLHRALDAASSGRDFRIPVFDKSIDDRVPKALWRRVVGPVDVVLLEGWCVGLAAQSSLELTSPVSHFEQHNDPDQSWRSYVNSALKNEYATLFARLDYQMVLQAPEFNCVFGWRLLQEQKMIERLNEAGIDTAGAQSPRQLRRFIAHFQRLSEFALRSMPTHADWIIHINSDQAVVSVGRSRRLDP